MAVVPTGQTTRGNTLLLSLIAVVVSIVPAAPPHLDDKIFIPSSPASGPPWWNTPPTPPRCHAAVRTLVSSWLQQR